MLTQPHISSLNRPMGPSTRKRQCVCSALKPNRARTSRWIAMGILLSCANGNPQNQVIWKAKTVRSPSVFPTCSKRYHWDLDSIQSSDGFRRRVGSTLVRSIHSAVLHTHCSNHRRTLAKLSAYNLTSRDLQQLKPRFLLLTALDTFVSHIVSTICTIHGRGV